MSIELRAATEADLPDLRPSSRTDDPFGWFGFQPSNGMAKRFAEDGLLGDRFGILIIESDGAAAGYVGWAVVQHGPVETSRALNVGVYVAPAARRQGVATAAQAALVEYLFETTLYERLEAATDALNIGEQRALRAAGFTFEGVLRHAQYRAGGWHDLQLFSVLRGERGRRDRGASTRADVSEATRP